MQRRRWRHSRSRQSVVAKRCVFLFACALLVRGIGFELAPHTFADGKDPATDFSAQKQEPTPSAGTTSSPEENYDPFEKLRLVCDHGTQRALRQSEVANFLQSHPGASLGPCPSTPAPSPSPSASARGGATATPSPSK